MLEVAIGLIGLWMCGFSLLFFKENQAVLDEVSCHEDDGYPHSWRYFKRK